MEHFTGQQINNSTCYRKGQLTSTQSKRRVCHHHWCPHSFAIARGEERGHHGKSSSGILQGFWTWWNNVHCMQLISPHWSLLVKRTWKSIHGLSARQMVEKQSNSHNSNRSRLPRFYCMYNAKVSLGQSKELTNLKHLMHWSLLKQLHYCFKYENLNLNTVRWWILCFYYIKIIMLMYFMLLLHEEITILINLMQM